MKLFFVISVTSQADRRHQARSTERAAKKNTNRQDRFAL
jgi:hypothetical protein